MLPAQKITPNNTIGVQPKTMTENKLDLPIPATHSEDPGAHELDSESDDHFSDAQSAPISPGGVTSPIPRTRVEKITDEPSYGEVPGTDAYRLREGDAAPDEIAIVSPKLDATNVDGSGNPQSPQSPLPGGHPVPTTVVEEAEGSSGPHSEEFQQKRLADATPDVVVKPSGETEENNSGSDAEAEATPVPSATSKSPTWESIPTDSLEDEDKDSVTTPVQLTPSFASSSLETDDEADNETPKKFIVDSTKQAEIADAKEVILEDDAKIQDAGMDENEDEVENTKSRLSTSPTPSTDANLSGKSNDRVGDDDDEAKETDFKDNTLTINTRESEQIGFSKKDRTEEGDVEEKKADEDAEFADDFDDFEEGAEGDDFDDFDDGFQQPDTQDDSPRSPSPPPPPQPQPTAHYTLPFAIPDFDGLENDEITSVLESYLDLLFPLEQLDAPHLPLPPKDTAAFSTPRSESLWSQLVAPPPLAPPDWIRSRIRRLFLVSLGVPVDLDEILPASKQKKLILPSFTTDGDNSHLKNQNFATATSKANDSSRTSADINASTAANPKQASPNNSGDAAEKSSRRAKGPPHPPELDAVAARQLCTTTDEALDGMTETELKGHVSKLEALEKLFNEAMEYWQKRADEKIGDREAFEGVIENLVKHARKVRK